jgi:hypothetical protein
VGFEDAMNDAQRAVFNRLRPLIFGARRHVAVFSTLRGDATDREAKSGAMRALTQALDLVDGELSHDE